MVKIEWDRYNDPEINNYKFEISNWFLLENALVIAGLVYSIHKLSIVGLWIMIFHILWNMRTTTVTEG
mgnify:FL=1